jgi:hypothetical protein
VVRRFTSRVTSLFRRWNRLHAIRSLLSATAFGTPALPRGRALSRLFEGNWDRVTSKPELGAEASGNHGIAFRLQ